MARLSVCAPIVSLLTVTQTRALLSCDRNGGLQLRSLNLLRPALNHPNALVDNKLFAHGVQSGLTTQAQRPGPRDAWIATWTRWPGSLQRMVRPRHRDPLSSGTHTTL